MSKSQMILVAALLAAMSSTAQQDQAVLLLSSEKPITYCTEDGTRYKNVQPGAVILKENTVKVPRRSTVAVYSGGVFKQLKPGKRRLSEELAEGISMRAPGFDSHFESYLLAAISLAKEANGMNSDWAGLINPQTGGDGWGVTDPKKSGDGWGVTDPKKSGDGWGVTDPKKSGDGWGVTDPKKSGDGWGVTDPKKSGDGWGGSGKSIHVIMPFGFILPVQNTTFSWSKPANAGPYILQIRDAADAVVYETTTQDTFAVVDLSGKVFAKGAHFVWRVRTVPEGSVLESNDLEILISDTEDFAEALKPLQRFSRIYPDADPVLRGLMEAIALERAEWFAAASQKYAGLIRSHPKNNLVRIMYATFWMRFGLVPLANAAVEK